MNDIKKKIADETVEGFSESIDNWSTIMLNNAVNDVSKYCQFSRGDMINLLIAFQEVSHSLAYHQNSLKSFKKEKARAKYFGEQLRQMMIDFCGFDPAEEVNNICKEDGNRK